MTKTDENTPPLSPVAQIVHDVIYGLRAEQRLYPDLYAEQVAGALAAAGLVVESE